LRCVGHEGPVAGFAGAVADADVGSGAAFPLVDREQRLFGFKVVNLHAAVTFGRGSGFVTKVPQRGAGVGDILRICRAVIARPEFDVAARQTVAGRDAGDIGDDIQVAYLGLKNGFAAISGDADLGDIIGEGIHRDIHELCFPADFCSSRK